MILRSMEKVSLSHLARTCYIPLHLRPSASLSGTMMERACSRALHHRYHIRQPASAHRSTFSGNRLTDHSRKNSLACSICSSGAGQSLHLLPSCPSTAVASGELVDDLRFTFFDGDDPGVDEAERLTEGMTGGKTARRSSLFTYMQS